MLRGGVPCLLLAARIVKDRPLSSFFSSMGGWRWKVFLNTFDSSGKNEAIVRAAK